MGMMAHAVRMVSAAAVISAVSVQLPRSDLWQGTHALLPDGDTPLLPSLPILTLHAIKKLSKYQGDDLSLVPKYFQKHQVLNQGV